MPPAIPQTLTDPLRMFAAGAFVRSSQAPLPLICTEFDITIDAGLAVVATTRRFRNAEPASIEATITFPVPVHAVLFELKTKIAGQVLKAEARRKKSAREIYEDAIEGGKTAVLHEEVLRGVHMLSVGHIPPGAEIEIESIWATTLTASEDACTLRIPLTVGDIYGRSPLPDADDLIQGGALQMARLSVACQDGSVRLLHGDLREGAAEVPLNAPIDLEVRGMTPKNLCGRAADGRQAVLRVEPVPAAKAPLDVALLVDHSGSMDEVCCPGDEVTKHEALVVALKASADELRDGDVLELWEFSDEAKLVGRAEGAAEGADRLRSLIGELQPPQGGTEIGDALKRVIEGSRARDILVITDGKSHALDVHELARQGRRIQVILIGADSLEANIGHLAALSGGEVFVTAGTDLKALFAVALRSVRAANEPVTPAKAMPDSISMRRAGMQILARWMEAAPDSGARTAVHARAVAAVAASLALPALPEEAAAELAEKEGLVTHLTSLVLVDEAGESQAGLPGTRKVALPHPAAMPRVARKRVADGPLYALSAPILREPSQAAGGAKRAHRISSAPSRGSVLQDLRDLACNIPWDQAPRELQTGNLDSLRAHNADMIRDAARSPEIISAAAKLNLHPIVLLIAVLAHSQAAHNRSAARIANASFGKVIPAEAEEIAQLLGLRS